MIFTFGEIFEIGMEHDYQRQIDRACSAQDSNLLPNMVDNKKLNAAQARVEKQKSKYVVPANSIEY